jgi:5-dehydro-2-deoxygluconokinase
MALAIDHRTQLEAIADSVGAPYERIGRFKELAVIAAARVANGRPGYGVLLDDRYGRDALFRAADSPLWVARPVEKPGSRPLEFENALDVGGRLRDWPVGHTVKCLCIYHPSDPATLRNAQELELRRLHEAVRGAGRELLIEIIAGRHVALETDTVADVLTRLYGLGIKPDWWKLEPQPSIAAWRAIETVVARYDPWCLGVVLLGLDAPEAVLEAALCTAAASSLVKGFAVGRTIFGEVAARWFRAAATDSEAVDAMAASFSRLCSAWQRAVAARPAPVPPIAVDACAAERGSPR